MSLHYEIRLSGAGGQGLIPAALLEVREAAAAERDHPPFKVLNNAVLLAWVENPPCSTRVAAANGSPAMALVPPVASRNDCMPSAVSR